MSKKDVLGIDKFLYPRSTWAGQSTTIEDFAQDPWVDFGQGAGPDVPEQVKDLTRQSLILQQQIKDEDLSMWDALDSAYKLEGVGRRLYDAAPLIFNRFENDLNWSPSREQLQTIQEWQPALQEDIIKRSKSQGHWDELYKFHSGIDHAQKELMKFGWGAIPATFAAIMFDPVTLGIIIGTEGAAAPIILASTASRANKMVRAGLVAMGSNATPEYILALHDPTRDWRDILAAAALGGSIGAGIMWPAINRSMAAQAARAMGKVSDELGGEDAIKAGAKVPDQKLVNDEYGTEVFDDAGTAGAAKAGSRPEERFDDVPEDAPHSAWTEIKLPFTSIRVPTRFTLAARFGGDKRNPERRRIGLKLVSDGVGLQGGRTQEVTVEAIAGQLMDKMEGRFGVAFNMNFPKWVKEQGNYRTKYGDAVDDFAKEVAHAVRSGDSSNKYVAEVADAIRKSNSELLEEAKKWGVKGWEDIADNPNYLTRAWSRDGFNDLNRRIGGNNTRNLIKQAILAGDNEIDDALAGRIAKAMWSRFFLSKGTSDHINLSRIFSSEDELIEVLEEAGTDLDLVEDLLAARRKSNQGEGISPRAKRRSLMDENFKMTMREGDFSPNLPGQDVEVSLSELFENNAIKLHYNYVRHVAGHIALARHGWKSKAEFHADLDKMQAKAADEYGPEAATKQREEMEFVYNHILGAPLEKGAGSTWAHVARTVRKINFSRVMNQVGIAQMAEFGNLFGQVGLRTMLDMMPEFRGMIRGAESGRMSNSVLDEIEQFFGGWWNDDLISHMYARADELGSHIDPGMDKFRKLDRGLDVANRVTGHISGFYAVDKTTRKMAALGTVHKIVQKAFAMDANGILKPIARQRLRQIGIGDDMMDRVADQIHKHVETEPGVISSRKTKNLNLKNWDDPEAREVFLHAARNWSNRIIQKNDLGNTPLWIHSTFGKLAFQFRSFMIGAYEKQLLGNLYNGDIRAYSSFMFSMMVAGTLYVGQTHVNALGMSESRKRKYLKDRLSTANIAKYLFQRAGFSSIMPFVVDTVGTMTFMDEPAFGYGRVSGLGTDMISGVASVDLADRMSRSVKNLVGMPVHDYNYSRAAHRDLWALGFFQNAFFITNINNMIQSDLPERSD